MKPKAVEVDEEYVSKIPRDYRAQYRKAMTGKSRRYAVKIHCLECCGWQRKVVTNCTATTCSLYPYRPYQKRDDGEENG